MRIRKFEAREYILSPTEIFDILSTLVTARKELREWSRGVCDKETDKAISDIDNIIKLFNESEIE